MGADLALEASLEEVLDEGLRRLHERGTWKLWQFDDKEFTDAESFRAHLHERRIPPELLRLLPKDDPRAPERPAEAALRQRMTELLARCQGLGRALQEEEQPAPPRTARRGRQRERQLVSEGALLRDANVDIICAVVEAMEQEHPQLYASVLRPVTAFVAELLGEGVRATKADELAPEDLDKLPAEEVARISEWLTEKVDALSTKTRIDPKEDEEEEEEEEQMGDVDLFALTPDGGALTVNAKWLQHLQERLLGDDGHPRKVRDGEDPHSLGLVLEWVYGSIVSTAEKGRDGAKRQLGSHLPSAPAAFDALAAALRDQAALEERRRVAKELLAEMLRSRREAAELAAAHGSSPAGGDAASALTAGGEVADGPTAAAAAAAGGELPDDVIVQLLKREALLTRAKLHALQWERGRMERELRSLRTQIKAGEPELERLKRELDELKHAPRGLEGSYRTAAEMERHRHQLADAAIEEQLEVQTAFREQGSKLQALYDRKQRTEYDLVKRDNEVKQLNGWKATVDNLVERFQDMLAQRAALAPDAAAAAAAVADVAGAGAATAAGGAEAGSGGAEAGAGAGEGAGGAEGRQALQAASVQVHINKMRCAAL
ncbi:hypothetical protein MNEG_14218 [Monoraphidium neglectum]|uniref:Uncharacterized protein n=1 Tax=Monoraphidium neglectum TaxID=145388 RepID=A0A0D2LPS2_9CHLO|nr:hypothetical protein MNEG_14218 [Monoraphidium neglectum]KIY93744.1 hypothetical protein MNEG_14218 [Monoraphidium neglectum]|eukprot:XP_013892764.1 hypothetical protein MNEG_14218 [Monoraphidium neglectum]